MRPDLPETGRWIALAAAGLFWLGDNLSIFPHWALINTSLLTLVYALGLLVFFDVKARRAGPRIDSVRVLKGLMTVIEYVAFGIIIDDIVFPDGSTRMNVLGGGGPQTAWGMAAVRGSGETVGLVAGVGADLDPTALTPMRAAGINLDGVRLTDLPTPRAWQVLEFNGRRTQVWRVPLPTLGAQLARDWGILPTAYHGARAFHWGIHPDEAGSLPFAHRLHETGRLVCLEPFRPSDQPLDDETLGALLAACDVFSPNLFEAVRITGCEDEQTMLARFRDLGGRVLALRRGAAGADVWDLQQGRGVHVPAVQTEVVDVVGAGNAFCGALIARLANGLDEAACHASAAASYLVEQVGLPSSLPTPADYARRLDEARAGRRVLQFGEV